MCLEVWDNLVLYKQANMRDNVKINKWSTVTAGDEKNKMPIEHYKFSHCKKTFKFEVVPWGLIPHRVVRPP